MLDMFWNKSQWDKWAGFVEKGISLKVSFFKKIIVLFFCLNNWLEEENWYELRLGRQKEEQICWWLRKQWQQERSVVVLYVTCHTPIRHSGKDVQKDVGELNIDTILSYFYSLDARWDQKGRENRKKYIEIVIL